MAQFDVFRNPAASRGNIPYVVSLQNARYDRVGTCLVAPLSLPAYDRVDPPWVTPSFVIEGRMVVLNVFGVATLRIARLTHPVWSLTDEESRQKIVRALDELLSQA